MNLAGLPGNMSLVNIHTSSLFVGRESVEAGPVGFEPTIFGSLHRFLVSEPDVLSWLSSRVFPGRS